MKILFICPYPPSSAPSQRFRFEQYFTFLCENNYYFEQHSFIDDFSWKILYKKGYKFQKISGVLRGFFRRFLLLFSVSKFDFVFIHREATPIGPPIFEWVVAKILRKKIIYDFDDAIWIPNTSTNNKIVASIKFHHKVKYICSWAYKVSAGNQFLQTYAQQFCKNAVFNPTTIDTINVHNLTSNHFTNKVIIGWTGTHSTLFYLQPLVPVIEKLALKFNFEFRLISNQAPDFEIPNLNFVKWNLDSEIEDLSQIQIGLMPLEEDAWAKGKCGFKALQYMALGTPALVSPVGVNSIIVQNDYNGFVCNTPEDWYKHLSDLIQNAEKRNTLGSNAKLFIENNYSVNANKINFLSLFS